MLLQIHLHYIISKTQCYCRFIYITLYLKLGVTAELHTLHYSNQTREHRTTTSH